MRAQSVLSYRRCKYGSVWICDLNSNREQWGTIPMSNTVFEQLRKMLFEQLLTTFILKMTNFGLFVVLFWFSPFFSYWAFWIITKTYMKQSLFWSIETVKFHTYFLIKFFDTTFLHESWSSGFWCSRSPDQYLAGIL